jgi:hypothetical protein
MTVPRITTAGEAAERILAELVEAADATLANKRGAMLAAADPARRAQMEAAHQLLGRWAPALRIGSRKVGAAHASLSRTLRKVKPGVRA